MIKGINYILMVMITGSLCSCYSPRYVYSPSATNVPLLAQKADSKLAGYYSFNPGEKNSVTSAGKLNSGYGLDIEAAYAITNHFAMHAAYTKRWEKNYADFNLNNNDSSLVTYSRSSSEAGLGYYTYLDKRKASFFQLFGGISLGKSSFTDKYFTGNIAARHFSMDVTRVYIQPAIMIRYGEVFASSFSSRVSAAFFRNIAADYTAEEMDRYQLKDIDKDAEIFWEPSFINTFGLKKLPGLKLEIQLGMAFLMSQHFVDYRTFNLAAGLVLDVPKFFDRKTANKN